LRPSQAAHPIASGNVLFESNLSASAVEKKLLMRSPSMRVGGADLVRTADERASVAKAEPFADQPYNRVVAIFINEAPPKEALGHARAVSGEALQLGQCEIYVHYRRRHGDERLKI